MRRRSSPAFYEARARAGAAVTQAKKCGELPYLSDGKVKCLDCGFRAAVYDHRDYDKPLEVQPVCNRCNFRRGPAKWSGQRYIEPQSMDR
jgi:hypothetical protein